MSINGQRQYLWRAVDQDGDVIEILVRSPRNRRGAERIFRKLLKGQGSVPPGHRQVEVLQCPAPDDHAVGGS